MPIRKGPLERFLFHHWLLDIVPQYVGYEFLRGENFSQSKFLERSLKCSAMTDHLPECSAVTDLSMRHDRH